MLNIKEYKAFSNNHAYQLRLITDSEQIAKAEMVYNAQHLVSKNHTLDSPIFGSTLMNPICEICFRRIEYCPGHYAVIQLPFPIVRAICFKDFKNIISILCPLCSSLLVPNSKNSLILAPENRLEWIRKEFDKYSKGGDEPVTCPVCQRKVPSFKVLQNEPCIRICTIDPKTNQPVHWNPSFIQIILQNFKQLDEIGFSINYHPKNFMTTVIPIIPNKLRPKNHTSSESILTSYYRVIIEEIVPELSKLYKIISAKQTPILEVGDLENQFNKFYDKLMAYYMLITDMGTDRTKEIEISLIEKRDKSHIDDHNALIGRFKGKEKSIFSKGIINCRVNVSVRSVLGGAIDAEIPQVSIPYHIASKLSMYYPVYSQNIKLMKQLIAAMSDINIRNNIHIPKVLGILEKRTGKFTKINTKNALTRASILVPGDKVAISLLNGDLVLQNRYPALREESWGAFQTNKEENSIITIPLPVCEMKMADFDGDEAQIYCLSSHVCDIEALLLHSTFQQYLAYKNGKPAVEYKSDGLISLGLSKVRPKATSFIYHDQLVNPPVNNVKIIEEMLPKDFNYSDSKTKIINGHFADDKTEINNVEMHKYMYSLYGAQYVEKFMDEYIRFAYDLARDYGSSIGYEMRIYGNEARKQIDSIVDSMYNEMKQIEQSNIKNKELIQINMTEKMKVQLKEILVKSAIGTNIDNLGYTKNKQEEFYQIVVLCDHILADGTRIQPILAEGTRTCCAFPRDSIDPCAYGFVKGGYNSDISPVSHFYECKQQRHSLFVKGKGVAKQGYMSKRLCVAYGYNYADYNGMLVNNFKIVSPQYGSCGLNPRLYTIQPLIDISLPKSDFVKKYASDKRLILCYDKIHTYFSKYKLFSQFTKTETIKNSFAAGFNYEIMINNYEGVEPNKKTEQSVIDTFISKLYNIYCPANYSEQYIKENLIQHEYYFRTKLHNNKCPEKLLDKLYTQFIWTLCDGGDAVGMKASIATTEPLTQANLHAIHHIGGGVDTDRIIRSAGVNRFEEIIGGYKCKYNVVTIKLYDDSLDSCKLFANEQETFYFNNIWTRLELVIADKIPTEITKLHPKIDLANIDIHSHFIRSIWNVAEISSYNIHVVDVINALMNSYTEIMFITGYVLNSTEFMAYIFFKPNVKVTQINLFIEDWSLANARTIIHGKYLKNCYVSENKNMPGHYIIEANEVGANTMGLQNLIFDERVDPMGCKCTTPEIFYKLFGVNEACARQYEELIFTAVNLSDTSGVLHRHYKCIADATYMTGEATYASRNSLRHMQEVDTMRVVQFETAKDMIQQNLKYGDIHPIADPVAAQVFGELPVMGTGASKVNLYVT